MGCNKIYIAHITVIINNMVTTIQVQNETRDKLKLFGHKGESYDSIIERLMNYCEELNIEELIEKRWNQLQREKEHYISLDEI